MLQRLLELVAERGAYSCTDLAQRLGVSEGATDVHLTLFGGTVLVAACLGWNTWRPK